MDYESACREITFKNSVASASLVTRTSTINWREILMIGHFLISFILHTVTGTSSSIIIYPLVNYALMIVLGLLIVTCEAWATVWRGPSLLRPLHLQQQIVTIIVRLRTSASTRDVSAQHLVSSKSRRQCGEIVLDLLQIHD